MKFKKTIADIEKSLDTEKTFNDIDRLIFKEVDFTKFHEKSMMSLDSLARKGKVSIEIIKILGEREFYHVKLNNGIYANSYDLGGAIQHLDNLDDKSRL
jgi:hypothetical protein